MQPPMQQPGIPKKSNTMLIVAVVAVVAIVIVAVLALVLMRGGAGMTIQITDWDSDETDLSTILSNKVTFSVDLTNTGTTSSTGTVTCKLTFPTGSPAQATKSVTLAAGASETVTIEVTLSTLQWAQKSVCTPTCTIA